MASVTCGLTAEDRDQLRATTIVLSMGKVTIYFTGESSTFYTVASEPAMIFAN